MKVTIENADTIHDISPPKPFGLIQVANYHGGWEAITLPDNCIGLLRLDFHGSYDFTTRQAQQVLAFAGIIVPRNIIVQCIAGEMRSPAIAAALLEILVGRGKGDVIWRDNRYRPLRGVYDRLLAEAGLR